jgi:tRNA (mo5U34)-methyltransferase
VLDIGAWDGWFSFRAESEGADRVVALDSFVWALDFTRSDEYWQYVRDREERGLPYERWGPDCAYWDAERLPGKRSFDLVRSQLESRVEPVVADLLNDDLEPLGTFDVTLFLGVVYHLREPLRGLERLRSLTREVAVIETAAIRLEGHADAPLLEFIERSDSVYDPTTWFVPTEQALHGLCRAAGFTRVETIDRGAKLASRGQRSDYRLVAHAWP